MAKNKTLSQWKKSHTCGYGCCTSGMSKKQINRGIRRIQKQSWKKEMV